MFTRTVLLAAVCLAFTSASAPASAFAAAQTRDKATSKPAPAQREPAVDPTTVTVYLAEIGNAYHRDTCRMLGKSGGISVTLAEAKKNGYEWCRVCKPQR